MSDKNETIYLTDLINNFLVTANGFRAIGVEADDETFRELLRDFCESIGLERNVFDHVQLDAHLSTAKELPDEVKQLRDSNTNVVELVAVDSETKVLELVTE